VNLRGSLASGVTENELPALLVEMSALQPAQHVHSISLQEIIPYFQSRGFAVAKSETVTWTNLWALVGVMVVVIGGGLAWLHSDMGTLGSTFEKSIGSLKTDLKSDITDLKTDVHGEMTSLKSEVAGIRAEVSGIRVEAATTNTKLDALIQNTQRRK